MEICVTRFNDSTFQENRNWITINNSNIGCIYGTPVKITENILPNTILIVIEMNNTKNIIEGIGIIKNDLVKENKKYFKIYSDNNYNRFIYKSNFRISKNNFSDYEKEVISFLEEYLFKSSSHCKRGQGIQKLPKKVANNPEFNFIKFLTNMYNKRFTNIKKIKVLKT